MRRSKKLLAADARKIMDLQDALHGLYVFVIEELEPDPSPIEAYYADDALGAVAKRELAQWHYRREARPLVGSAHSGRGE